MAKDILRRCRFEPYRKGAGPVFWLTVWDAGERFDESVNRRRTYLGYRLSMTDGRSKMVLFNGEDFGCPAIMTQGDSIDSDSTLANLMGFLTLKPGDTEADYFKYYTPTQLRYCEQHAEALNMAVIDRFGEH